MLPVVYKLMLVSSCPAYRKKEKKKKMLLRIYGGATLNQRR